MNSSSFLCKHRLPIILASFALLFITVALLASSTAQAAFSFIGTGQKGTALHASNPGQTELATKGSVVEFRNKRVLITDTDNHRVLVVNTDGTLELYAGTGTEGKYLDTDPSKRNSATRRVLLSFPMETS